jgi:hypothetical protein
LHPASQHIIRLGAMFGFAFAAACGVARAQAWVPSKGEGSISFTYQIYDVAGHFNASGNIANDASTYSQSLVTELDYGLTDAFALTLSLPFVASRYTGPPSYNAGGHPVSPGPLDDGNYHAAFQDVRIEVRRLFWLKGVAVAPFGGLSFPTHDYETAGEAVPGRHRNDYQIGASAGTDLGRVVPDAYVQVRYAYGTMQRIEDYPFTRSNIDVEGGKAPASWLLLRGLVNWQIRHQGPTLEQLYEAGDWQNHDRFVVSSYFNLGAGTSLSITHSADVFVMYVATVAGSNGAHRGRLLAVGTTWGFGNTLGGLIGGHALPSVTRTTGPAVFR